MGGTKIPYARQDVTEEDIEAVVRVLRSDFLAQGPVLPAFEEAVAGAVRARHGVAVNSATSALHMACLALGVGPGDIVWTSPITFVASANAALYCGASVDFVDIDPRTWNLSPVALAEKLEHAARNGRLPKVVIAVHFTGEPAAMAEIGALCRAHGVAIVEDAAHALGAACDGTPVGANIHADMTVFSFHPVKIITTGEGGLITTNRDDLAAKLHALRSHGITRDPAALTVADAGGWYYEQQSLGYNFRMTDIQAALGLSQLQRLDQYINRRQSIAALYDAGLEGLPVVRPYRAPGNRSALHLYVVRLPEHDRRVIYDGLHAAGIAVNVHYIPVHLQPYYQARGFRPGDFPEAERYYADALSLPMYPRLADDDVARVIETLRGLL